ncbi:MAG: DNA polymerase Y family protein [Novosphingobium sp.]|nr:DNA polymerase Y family protein [Novosphingobium sp.]
MPGPLPLTGTYPAAAPPDPASLPPRRILAIWLRDLAMDRWRLSQELGLGEGADASPLALVAESARGVRITAANAAGLAAGANPGTALADARTLCPALATAPSDPAGDLAFLEKLALWAQRWGPWSALDAPDGLIVDVTGVAHLFGGEEALLADVRAALARRHLAARLAIAPTAGAAWALAHYGPDGTVLLPQDNAVQRLAQLPVAALRLDDDVLLVLRRLGLKRLGDLSGVARDALARRFRNRRAPAANPLIRMDQLLGMVPEPTLPVIEQHAPLVQRRLLEPIRHRDLLDRVVADLAEDMARVLEGRGLGARRLELGMWKVDGEVLVRRLELAAPSRDSGHISGLFGRHLDHIDAGFGIEMVRLRSMWSENVALSQGDIEAAAEGHGTSLAAFIDRLVARLGARAVRRPVLRASHVPERVQAWVGALEPDKSSQEAFEFHHRPLKLLDNAERIAVLYASPDGLPRRFRWRGEVHEVARAEGPERISPEWWRERGSVRLRDYYRIEDGQGRRYWIYRDGIAGDGRGGDAVGRPPDWFLQGLWG